VRVGRASLRFAAALALVAALLVSGGARADRLDEAWRRGNEAYLHGDYRAAIAAYEELERQGVVSGDLAFNRGDAYFRKGDLGRAIWAFERAAALDPGDDDARYNLDQARKLAARQARDKIEGEDREPAWIRIVTALGPSTETWLFVALYLGFFAALVLALQAPDEARPVRGAAAAVLGVGALLAGALLFGRAHLDKLPFGIVLPDAVAVKEGADVNYRTSFDVHAGLRVRVMDQDQDWLRIRLANGLEGWVRAPDVGRL
jgi:tetratricopeptide (TPR) repeat protein